MASPSVTVDRFRHEALLYSGMDQFLDRLVPFLSDGVAAGEPSLVVVSAQKIQALKRRLGKAASGVEFADMASVGANPARIIPAWRQFVDLHKDSGRRLRGIGEPIYPERSPMELVECVRHESLLNVAFDSKPAWWLVCPYDTKALPAPVIEAAHRTHPFVMDNETRIDSRLYPGVAAAGAPFGDPLPEPEKVRATLRFEARSLAAVRRLVYREAARAGFAGRPIGGLVEAVNEVATNSIRHGGGSGRLRIWLDGNVIVCEIRDSGRLTDPLADRRRPQPQRDGGRGLWLANQGCDLLQIRSFSDGTVARLHLRRDPAR